MHKLKLHTEIMKHKSWEESPLEATMLVCYKVWSDKQVLLNNLELTDKFIKTIVMLKQFDYKIRTIGALKTKEELGTAFLTDLADSLKKYSHEEIFLNEISFIVSSIEKNSTEEQLNKYGKRYIKTDKEHLMVCFSELIKLHIKPLTFVEKIKLFFLNILRK